MPILFSTSCALLYPPPTTWFVFPVAQFSSDSMSVPDYSSLAEGREDILNQLTIGVLRNPNRAAWNSKVAGDFVDERVDENVLLAEFLLETELFKDVVLVDTAIRSDHDFILTCSVDCIYSIDLDGWMYTFNCLTLGIGFLLGWPHQDPSAFYVSEALIYDNRGSAPVVVTGSLAMNYKEWYCDNIYWRPDFYGASALEPLFEQILYDFLSKSGCFAEEAESGRAAEGEHIS
jgi:hypothetical protein